MLRLSRAVFFVAVAVALTACMSGAGPAPEVAEGKPFPERTLKDQDGNPVEIPGDARVILKAVEAAPSRMANTVMSDMSAAERETLGIVFISDIHQMPPYVKENVVLPRMRAREYSTVVTDSPADAGFMPHEREQVTVVLLDGEGTVTQVGLAASKEALARMIDEAGE